MSERSSEGPSSSKASLRLEMKSRLHALCSPKRQALSTRASHTLLELVRREIPPALPLAVFASTPEEISLDPVLEALARRHPLVWPRVEAERLSFRLCAASALETGGRPWLREPPLSAPELEPYALVVPGRAFDARGGRLGRGAGFYDRALSALPHGLRLGYCFSFQRLDSIPTEPHDERMDWLVTDEGPALRCGRGQSGADDR